MTLDKMAPPTWQDMPHELFDPRVMYRDGRARVTVERVHDDDPSQWDDNEGQIPFWIPAARNHIESRANEKYWPEPDLDALHNELGDLDAVARFLRIFCDNVRIAEASKINTGYSQGDFSEVLTIVTDEWLEMTGCTVEQARNEIQFSGHMKEFAAWAAGDYSHVTFETLDPLNDCECDELEPGCCAAWREMESFTDPMDGPLHDIQDVNKWLDTLVHINKDYGAYASTQHDKALKTGHYAI